MKDEDAPVEEMGEDFSQYSDPKYAEEIMKESLMLGVDEPPANRKGPASETGEGDAAAEASQV